MPRPQLLSLKDIRGAPLSGVQVAIYLSGTQTLATVYSDDGVTAKSNPFTNDANGQVYFWAAGNLRVDFSKAGHPNIPSVELEIGGKSVLFMVCNASQTAGTTRYYGANGPASTEADVVILAPYACVARRITGHCNPAPGGTETAIFTFRKNLGDTALATTVTGAATQNQGANEVALANLDAMAVKVVTSGGAATLFAKSTFELHEA